MAESGGAMPQGFCQSAYATHNFWLEISIGLAADDAEDTTPWEHQPLFSL